jgi:hypothetical protein
LGQVWRPISLKGGPHHPFSRRTDRYPSPPYRRYEWGFFRPPARNWKYAGLIELRANSGLENADFANSLVAYALALETAIGTRLPLTTHSRCVTPSSCQVVTPDEALEAAFTLWNAFSGLLMV